MAKASGTTAVVALVTTDSPLFYTVLTSPILLPPLFFLSISLLPNFIPSPRGDTRDVDVLRRPVCLSLHARAFTSLYIPLGQFVRPSIPLWFRTTMIRDVSTGPLAHPFARSLAPLSHLLAPHCSLRSFVHLLAHSLTPKLMGEANDSMF